MITATISSRQSIVLILACLVSASLLTGCHSEPQDAAPSVTDQAPAGQGEHSAGDMAKLLPETLKRAGLEQRWAATLPLVKAESYKRCFLHNHRLFALDDRNVLYAIDAETGIIQWSTVLAPARAEHQPINFYRDRLLFVFGNTYLEVRESDGKQFNKRELLFQVSTGAARNETLMFLGSRKGRFYAIRLADGVTVWQAAGESFPTGAVAASHHGVYFARQNGRIYASRASRRELIWGERTAGAVPGVILDRGQCLAPSDDTALYCFDPNTGEPCWPGGKYRAGGRLRALPAVTEESIYQPIYYRSLLCLDRQTGTPRWELPHGSDLLAETDHRSYVVTFSNELVIMNNDTGKMELSFLVPGMDLFVRNTESEMIFLANREGKVMALKPGAD